MITIKRFFSSIIDKIIIILLFVGINLLISMFTGASEIGIFTGCIGASQKSFEYMPNGEMYPKVLHRPFHRNNVCEYKGCEVVYGIG